MAEIKTILTKEHIEAIIEDHLISGQYGDYLEDDGFQFARAIEADVLSANAGKVDESARIDWLEQRINEYGAIHLHDGKNPAGYGLGLINRTLREAIDTARMASPTQQAIDAGKV